MDVAFQTEQIVVAAAVVQVLAIVVGGVFGYARLKQKGEDFQANITREIAEMKRQMTALVTTPVCDALQMAESARSEAVRRDLEALTERMGRVEGRVFNLHREGGV